MKKKVMLMILDGFGLSENNEGNAIKAANTPNLDKLFHQNLWTKLKCSGNEVGLPKGIMGNSEVGHLNIGAGRIVYQDITRINKSIRNKSFFENHEFKNATEHCKKFDSSLHLFGLVSDGKVHSSLVHLWALLKMAKQNNLTKVYLHAFMDGRDTSPHSGKEFVEQCLSKMKEIGVGKIATISGRYYAMDRDNRWKRVQKAYDAIVYGKGNECDNPIKAITKSYAENITDEFIIPTVLQENDQPVASVRDNDSIIFFNFRADRAREITKSFILPQFDKFPTKKYSNLSFTSMTEYEDTLSPFIHIAFKPIHLKNVLGKILADNNISQLRIAETEKYAHVTFFFNGGVEKPFKNEERILISSPKVATYDLQPEMSAFLVCNRVIAEIRKNKFQTIILNFANSDMVGHTGDFKAAVKAVETVDECVGKIVRVLYENDYKFLITADHGNAEQMLAADGSPFTAHTTNKVPFITSERDREKFILRNDGKLADIAPTILYVLNIPTPKEFTGKSLIKKV
ncbi:MAG: 2,3-bisphosphoglycerate-independent phosphoglycerate mutase [Candidatus Cloacimonadota bacterium]|nr:2,3-bisphosphoglycerate-independent phosphoglycerate mutase [Candidatus Cloacimonadota bacterium]